ncbi:hypothetical protein STEG23_010287 [Scotinomys teguina]
MTKDNSRKGLFWFMDSEGYEESMMAARGTGEMAQHLGALAALPEDPDSIFNTYMSYVIATVGVRMRNGPYGFKYLNTGLQLVRLCGKIVELLEGICCMAIEKGASKSHPGKQDDMYERSHLTKEEGIRTATAEEQRQQRQLQRQQRQRQQQKLPRH